MQLPKTAGSIKLDGPQIGSAYREVRAARAGFRDRSKPLIHQSTPKALATKARQKVEVEVRRIALDDLTGHLTGVVNSVHHQLVQAPPGARDVGRIIVDSSEARPPLCFQDGCRMAR